MKRRVALLLVGAALVAIVTLAAVYGPYVDPEPAPAGLDEDPEDHAFSLTPVDPEEDTVTLAVNETQVFRFHCAFPEDAPGTGVHANRSGPSSHGSSESSRSGTHVSPDTGNVTFTASFDPPGTHTLTVQCEAGDEQSNPHSWTVHVAEDDT